MDPATYAALSAMIEKAVTQVQIYFAALAGLVFYEWLVGIPREYEYIWKADWTFVKICYLVIRYSGVAHAILDLYAFFGVWEADTCARFVRFIPFIPEIGVVAAHCILLIQCHAVWNRNKFVLFALVPLIFSETVIMSVSSWVHIGAIPLLTPTGPCLPRALSAFCILYFAMPMAFDLSCTVLTAIKVLQMRKDDNGIGVGSQLLNTIIKQSFQYFLFITIANLANIVYYVVDVNDPASSLNGPLAIIATEIFACRLTLALREVKALKGPQTFVNPEKKQRHFVKIIMFGDDSVHATELSTIAVQRPISAHTPV